MPYGLHVSCDAGSSLDLKAPREPGENGLGIWSDTGMVFEATGA